MGNKKKMNSRERILAAVEGRMPDYVPICPDVAFYIPAILAGKKFHRIDEPCWKLHLRATERFGFDMLLPEGLGPSQAGLAPETSVLEDNDERRVSKYIYKTSKGILSQTIVFPSDDAPWHTEYLVKDMADIEKLEDVFFIDPRTRNTSALEEAVASVGNEGIIRVGAFDPFSQWAGLRGEQRAIEDLMDFPAQMKELYARINEQSIEYVRFSIEKGAGMVVTGGSSLSLLSPQLFMEFSCPYLKKFCREVQAAGGIVYSHHHGRCNAILEQIVDYGTDILDPLEPPPMGDVDLKDAKKRIGARCCLKGNVDTVNVLERGTEQDIEKAVAKCMEDAKDGGRYILSSADQISRDTPFRNIEHFVACGRKYGRY